VVRGAFASLGSTRALWSCLGCRAEVSKLLRAPSVGHGVRLSLAFVRLEGDSNTRPSDCDAATLTSRLAGSTERIEASMRKEMGHFRGTLIKNAQDL